MPPKYIHTEVDGRKLKLSNLDKVLYPDANVSKAEVIQYYLDISTYMLKYISGRPLTLIRFPDGIHKKKFYSKSKPDWTPEWINSVRVEHSDEYIDYVIADNQAVVVWLANLAALEIHPMQMTKDAMDFPDHFIFDLDPPEGGDFEVVKHIALRLKLFLESYKYKPFIKTSGSKGLHIYVPIVKSVSHELMTTGVKKLAQVFVTQNKETCTLAMSKEKREGKTLIDIFRNHASHTTVAPYSLRGQSGAPISFPITWDKVSELQSSKDITIYNYREYLDQYGDPWEDFYESAVTMHNAVADEQVLDEATREKLSDYISKRDFDVTPEPGLLPSKSSGNLFCIQIHDAQNLHYDLRLEKDGVLMSWAIPKGLPHDMGVKRLAIRTEDHPMQYLTFEGVIPKGQYGAGEMWIFAKGEIEWIEKSEKKYKFKLKAKGFNRRYNLFKTKGKQWLIEMLSNEDYSSIVMPIQPMLANMSKTVPVGSQYIYEIKWDGIRVIIFLHNEEVTIYSRSGRDISDKFPELLDAEMFDVESGIFDGEIVVLDEKGRPMFSNVISRMHTEGEKNIERVMRKYPAISYLFDAIMIDGKYIVSEPLHRRQAWIDVSLKSGKAFRVSETITDGKALFSATKDMNMEGIMAKDKNAPYSIGQRSDAWLKVKHRSMAECYIAGYTKGQGDRSDLFGALHLLVQEADGWKYMGKVGTGFDHDKMKELLADFQSHIISSKPFEAKTDDDNNSVWLEPVLKCDIQYASLASTGVYREPVFLRLLDV